MTSRLELAVGKVPELYQPVYQHPEFDDRAARACIDRLATIRPIHDLLRAELGRPVRVLDIGSAQGFFSLNLAAAGASVTGLEPVAANVELSELLRDERSNLDARFVCARLEDACDGFTPGEFDIVLALSVLHHTCNEYGQDRTRSLLAQLGGIGHIVLTEMALASEPMYWARSLPAEPRSLLSRFAFVHCLGKFPTHLSEVTRPLYFCSDRFWYLNGRLEEFAAWTMHQHEVAQDFFRGSRRYFFSDRKIAKYFLLEPAVAQLNCEELESEARLLLYKRSALPDLPEYEGWGIDQEAAWLVRELIPGRRLSELMARGLAYDAWSVVHDVLRELAVLEGHALYHADVRVWNVLVRNDDRATLIDYGSIGTTPKDGNWPYDIHSAFLLFVREVASRRLPRPYPTRPPLLHGDPEEPRLACFARAAASLRSDERSFVRFLELIESTASSECVSPSTDDDPPTRWRKAIEANLDIIGQELQYVRQWIEHDWRAASEAETIHLDEPGKRPLPSLVDQLDSLAIALSSIRSAAEHAEITATGAARDVSGLGARLADARREVGIDVARAHSRLDALALDRERDQSNSSAVLEDIRSSVSEIGKRLDRLDHNALLRIGARLGRIRDRLVGRKARTGDKS